VTAKIFSIWHDGSLTTRNFVHNDLELFYTTKLCINGFLGQFPSQFGFQCCSSSYYLLSIGPLSLLHPYFFGSQLDLTSICSKCLFSQSYLSNSSIFFTVFVYTFILSGRFSLSLYLFIISFRYYALSTFNDHKLNSIHCCEK